jgi:exodeoxyribonuclease X
MTIRVIDIETTGTDSAKDRVIEIASVDVTKTGIGEAMSVLINPGMPIPPESSAIHHLIDEDVAGEKSIDDVIERFQGADYYVAHNADFEQGFLEPWLGVNWICTYKCALRVWPDFPAHSNQALRYRLGLHAPFGRDRKSINPHRALDDCLVTAAIFQEIVKLAKWADIVRWSGEPPLLTRFNFGKHFGQRWDEVDPAYLRWIQDKMVDNKVAQFNAAYWLDQIKDKAAAP